MIEMVKADMFSKLQAHPKRITHVLGVAETAKKIAAYYKIDQEKAYLAGLLHDYMKYETFDFFKQTIGFEDIIKYHETPIVYHAIAAANYYLNIYGDDLAIYEAIRYHVWGHIDMNPIAKVVFVSDYCEPSRTIPDKDYIYELAFKDLDQCVLYCMQATKKDLESRNLKVSIEQIESIQYYEELVKHGKNK